MELLITIAIFSYIIYLRYYADLRTKADKESDQLQMGIKLFESGQTESAFTYFDQQIEQHPRWSIAYLYRARCHLKLGNAEAALDDLHAGQTYDDTVADLHTELGRVYYDHADYTDAFTEFDKAVFHSQGLDAMPYYWRGLTRQKLDQPQEAQHDLDQAIALEEQAKNHPEGKPAAPRSFFDRRFLINAGFVLLNSLLLLFVIKQSPVIHWPYILAASSAAAIGFAESRKGWALAILQAVILFLGYTLFTDKPTNNQLRGLEAFNLYGSIGLTFVGSFIGGILKRAMA